MQIFIALVSFVLTAVTASAAEPSLPSLDGYLEPQTQVHLPDGRRYNMVCKGEGGPLVIFIPGLHDWSLGWPSSLLRFSKITRTCIVDRAGYGFSSPGPMPRDGAADVSDLYEALRVSGLRPPYILAGHSLGGLEARLFAYSHPELVSGLILIDPSIEHHDARMSILEAITDKDMEFDRYCLAQARAGKIVAGEVRPGDYGPCAALPMAQRPADEKRRLLELRSSPAYFDAVVSERESMGGRTSDEVEAAHRKLGSIPLIILTRDKPHPASVGPDLEADRQYAVLIDAHNEQARDSTLGENRIVIGASHGFDERADALIAAFREVTEAARIAGKTAADK